MLARLPIRARLTAAFALAMVVVLAAAALFTYLRVRADLDEGVDDALAGRMAALAAAVERTGPGGLSPGGAGASEAEDGFAQVLGPGGRRLATAGGARVPALTPDEAERVAGGAGGEDGEGGAAGDESGGLTVEREVSGVEARARVLARPGTAAGRPVVLVVGTSLEDRDDTLTGLLATFALGGPVAIALACLLGWVVAGRALAPVEAMRARAAGISLRRAGERLPVPAADDELLRLADTLNKMLARIEASLARERRFTADAGHELRTPLTVVRAELEAALRATEPGAPEREGLVAALDEVEHLTALADDLLLVAQAGDEGLAVRPEALRARDVLDQARERFRARAEREGRRIDVDAPAELRLHADPLRLRQALGNLVDNALRHGAGTVTLAARRDGAGAVALEVGDEGAGVAPDLAPHAFERFTRGDEARTERGAGLGLAIVRAIAEAHGGSAAIEGAVVRVRLPG